MKFPDEWWIAVEVLYATASFGCEFGDGKYDAAVAAYRKSNIGRKSVLRARDFDNAARGVRASMAGHPDTIASALIRARWHIVRGERPAFVRPSGWDWQPSELDVIRISRARSIDPLFMSFDESGIDKVPGPATGTNPWDKWRKL